MPLLATQPLLLQAMCTVQPHCFLQSSFLPQLNGLLPLSLHFLKKPLAESYKQTLRMADYKQLRKESLSYIYKGCLQKTSPSFLAQAICHTNNDTHPNHT